MWKCCGGGMIVLEMRSSGDGDDGEALRCLHRDTKKE